MMTNTTTDAERIERELDQTRSRLGNHLTELQDRLSPGQVLDDLLGYFRGSEGAEFGRSLLDNVRGNPMPAAITTIGLAWLMASEPRSNNVAASPRTPVRLPIYGHDDHEATLGRLTSVQQSVSRNVSEPDHAYSARLDIARGDAIGLARHADETTESFGERVRHAIAAMEDVVTGKAHDLRDQASAAADAAGEAIRSVGTSAQSTISDATAYAGGALSSGGKSVGQVGSNLVNAITESPVLLGALGLAAGALLGAMLPHSDQEEAALGGIAGQTRDAVRNLANDGKERSSRVVQSVSKSARSAVDKQGLAGEKSAGQLVDAALDGNLAAGAKEVASAVLSAGEDAIRKEGLAG